MGTKTEPLPEPEPVPPGNQCNICWGEDKPFGDVTTPSRIGFYLSGSRFAESHNPDLPEPINDQTIMLDQVTGVPCEYFGETLEWGIRLRFESDKTYLRVDNFVGLAMLLDISEICLLWFLCDWNQDYIGGTVLLFIPESV